MELLHIILLKALTHWMPLEISGIVNKLIADFFIIKAYEAQGNCPLQEYCVAKAMDFIFEQANLDMIVSWYTVYDGKVVINERELDMVIPFELSYAIIKKAFKSLTLT